MHKQGITYFDKDEVLGVLYDHDGIFKFKPTPVAESAVASAKFHIVETNAYAVGNPFIAEDPRVSARITKETFLGYGQTGSRI